MLIYKYICDCCGKEFDIQSGYEVTIDRIILQRVFDISTFNQTCCKGPKKYTICAKCMNKFPIDING